MLKKILKVVSGVIDKVICIFDDIPFLLKGIGVLTGLFTLIGAGYLIFGLQLCKTIREFKEACAKSKEDDSRTASILTSLAKVIYAIMGLVITTGLLALTVTGLAILAVATSSALILAAKTLLLIASSASAIIPLIMGVVAGFELLQALDDWMYANDAVSAEEAKTRIIYNAIYLGLAIAVIALATVTVILGPGIHTFILVGVIGVSVALKLYQEREAIWEIFCKMRNFIQEKFCCSISELALTNDLTNNADLHKVFKRSSSDEPLTKLTNSSDAALTKEPVIKLVKIPVIEPESDCIFSCCM